MIIKSIKSFPKRLHTAIVFAATKCFASVSSFISLIPKDILILKRFPLMEIG